MHGHRKRPLQLWRLRRTSARVVASARNPPASVLRQTFCFESYCASLDSDRNNCGNCGSVCPTGSCMDGQCLCGEDSQLCDGECVENGCVCGEGRTYCGGFCVDLTGDPTHCGDCRTTCPPGETCTGPVFVAAATGHPVVLRKPASAVSAAVVMDRSVPRASSAVAARVSTRRTFRLTRTTAGPAGATATVICRARFAMLARVGAPMTRMPVVAPVSPSTTQVTVPPCASRAGLTRPVSMDTASARTARCAMGRTAFHPPA